MNADDICAELAAARAYITRGDTEAALECLDQCVKLWAAERDYWALIEVESLRATPGNCTCDFSMAPHTCEWCKEIVTATTAAENERIRNAQHNRFVRWVGGDYV